MSFLFVVPWIFRTVSLSEEYIDDVTNQIGTVHHNIAVEITSTDGKTVPVQLTFLYFGGLSIGKHFDYLVKIK